MNRKRDRFGSVGCLLAGLVAAMGCHKGATPAPAAGGPAAPAAPAGAPPPVPPQHVDGTAHTDTVENAWRAAGLAPEGFAPLQPVPYGASYCEQGRVQTIDTLVCEFRDQGTLGKGQAALLEQWGREGGHTGVAFHAKLTVVGVVDRARHDPNGKVIHQVIDTFRKL
jgi:hypothetical protein